MTTQFIYPNGTSPDFTIANGSKVAIATLGPNSKAALFYRDRNGIPALITTVTGSVEYVSSAVTADTIAYIDNTGPDRVLFNVAASPIVTIPQPGVPAWAQTAPAAKTVSATLTTTELQSRLITVNQGAGAASALQLPLGTAMDTAFPEFAANDAFDFTVINTSTTAAETASLTTNTGWTLVGAMDIPAYSAAGSLNSSARFLARKTFSAGGGTWTLYRVA
jgi:hypothetical protein